MNTKKIPKQLKVVASYAVSPHLQRLEFTTDDIQYFAADSAGQYVKLMFTPSGSTDLSLLAPEQRPVLRTYTIRAIDIVKQRLEIDFVKHQLPFVAGIIEAGIVETAAMTANLPTPEQGGYGQYFAEHAKIGDTIDIRGPGAVASIDCNAAWLLLVADMTSLPALGVVMQALPADARGYVVFEVLSAADAPAQLLESIKLPANVQLIVSVRGQAKSLAQTVASLPWLAGQPSVWCACEFSDMKAIRSYVTGEHEVDRVGCYFSSYWKEGVTEDGHQAFKLQDKESANNG